MKELIQYVDEQGRLTGETEEKLAAHHAHTRKHLAFSLYLFDRQGRFLVTQRAGVKKVWPNVWTNSCCGHPLPGESMEVAIRRRLMDELGVSEITGLTCVLADYSYITPPCNGIIENELCPVYCAFLGGGIEFNPAEVQNLKWLSWKSYKDWIGREPELFSYWCKDQLPQLDEAVKMVLKRQQIDV